MKALTVTLIALCLLLQVGCARDERQPPVSRGEDPAGTLSEPDSQEQEDTGKAEGLLQEDSQDSLWENEIEEQARPGSQPDPETPAQQEEEIFPEEAEWQMGDGGPGQEPQEVSIFLLQEEKVEELLLELINQSREGAGQDSLTMDGELRLGARIRSEEILEWLSHTRPDGSAYHTVLDETGYSYAGKQHGENILLVRAPDGLFDNQGLAQRIFQELEESQGHYSNLHRESFADVGIGLHLEYHDGLLTAGCAQLFAGE